MMANINMEPIQTFIINLESQTSRRKRISTAMLKYPFLNAQIVKGVVGKELPEEEKRRLVHPKYSKIARTARMADSEIGCGMSHLMCYQNLISSADSIALVLEDDVLFGENFPSGIRAAAAFLKGLARPAVVLLSARTICDRKACLSLNGVHIHTAYFGVGAYGYMINKRGAELMLARMTPFRFPCDLWYHIRKLGIATFAVVPHVVSFSDDFSDSNLDTDRYRNRVEYRAQIEKQKIKLPRKFHNLRFERIELKVRKLLFGAVECPKVWP